MSGADLSNSGGQSSYSVSTVDKSMKPPPMRSSDVLASDELPARGMSVGDFQGEVSQHLPRSKEKVESTAASQLEM